MERQKTFIICQIPITYVDPMHEMRCIIEQLQTPETVEMLGIPKVDRHHY